MTNHQAASNAVQKPRAVHIDRIEFQKALLECLPQEGSGKKGRTVQELVRHFFDESVQYKAHVRKVQRELQTLVQEGKAVVQGETVRPGPYRYLAARDKDAVDPLFWGYLMQNITQHIASVVPAQRLDAALKKLHEHDGGPRLGADIFQVAPDTLALLPAQFNPVVLATILLALTTGKAIQAKYRYRDGTFGDLVLHPQGAVQSGPRFFLHVLVEDEERYVQVYALHRFTSVQVLEEPARKAPGFDLAKAVEARDPNEVPRIRIELLTRSFVTDLLRDCPLSEDQNIEDEDRYPGFNARVTATVTNSLLLERWLMGRGTSLCVLTPRALADKIAVQAGKIARMHAEPPRPRAAAD